MDTGHKIAPSRRNFLLAAGIGGIAAAAAAVTGGSPSSQHGSPKDKQASQGYRLTEHVRNYYRTTQI